MNLLLLIISYRVWFKSELLSLIWVIRDHFSTVFAANKPPVTEP